MAANLKVGSRVVSEGDSAIMTELLAEHEALDVVGAARGSVAGDEGGAHLWVALGGLEFAGHTGEEAGEDELFFYADHRVVGAGHAYVGLVGGAVGEDALVGCGDVGMGA